MWCLRYSQYELPLYLCVSNAEHTQALQQFDLQDLCTLLDKLVFALPGYARSEDGTTDLLPSLIKTAAEHIEPPELGTARPLLSLLLSLATVNMPRLEKFLSFFTSKFLQGNRLEKYNVADRVVILSTYGEALSAFQFPGKTQVRNAAWNVCPYVVQVGPARSAAFTLPNAPSAIERSRT